METKHFRLPNALVNREYEGLLGDYLLKAPAFAEGLEPTGLIYDAANLRIHGKPTEAGDYRIRFFEEADRGTSTPVAETLLVISPDPKAMWTELEPATALPFPSDHESRAQILLDSKSITAASKRGRSHAREGGFREDAFAIAKVGETGWCIAVAADGAGSAEYSREGARVACRQAVQHLAGTDWVQLGQVLERDGSASPNAKELLYKVLCGTAFDAHKAIRAKAEETGFPVKEFACTFTLLLHKRLQTGDFFAVFGIGDSPAVVLDENGQPIVLHTPEEGEFSGQTWFLTQSELFANATALMNRIKTALVPSFKATFLMTDGIYDPWFETRNGLQNPAKWEAMRQDLMANGVDLDAGVSADKLLQWLDFWSIGNHDDRTIIILK